MRPCLPTRPRTPSITRCHQTGQGGSRNLSQEADRNQPDQSPHGARRDSKELRATGPPREPGLGAWEAPRKGRQPLTLLRPKKEQRVPASVAQPSRGLPCGQDA